MLRPRRDPWAWLGPLWSAPTKPAVGVPVAVVLVLLLRAPFLSNPLESDEAGYLLVAEQWERSGPYLYGDFWVDRPPLLMAVFSLAGWFGDQTAIRVVGGVAAVLLVLGAGLAGHAVAGNRGAWWGAISAAIFAGSPAFHTQPTNGELLAAPLVMWSVALALCAVAQSATRPVQVAAGFAAGVSGAAAVLVKQNFVGGLVFGAVLICGLALTRARPSRHLFTVLAAVAAGVLATAATTLWWVAQSGQGLSELWWVMYGFRLEAAEVIAEQRADAPLRRLGVLLVLFVVSGASLAVWVFLRAHLPRRSAAAGFDGSRRRDPIAVATAALFLVAVAGIALGASYWSRYLIQLIPALSLAAAVAASPRGLAGRPMRRAMGASATSACLGIVAVLGFHAVTGPPEGSAMSAGERLADASRPGDSAVVLYGHANVLQRSGLDTPYPFLWSLQQRTLDPGLAHLRAMLVSPRAPTWVVVWDPVDSWEIDLGDRLARLLQERYREVTEICGRAVLLRADLVRRMPPAEPECGEY